MSSQNEQTEFIIELQKLLQIANVENDNLRRELKTAKEEARAATQKASELTGIIVRDGEIKAKLDAILTEKIDKAFIRLGYCFSRLLFSHFTNRQYEVTGIIRLYNKATDKVMEDLELMSEVSNEPLC